MTVKVGKEYPAYYRWVMLVLFVVMNFVVNFCQFQPSFFAQDIMETFGITSQSFTLMTSLPMAVGLFLAVIAGQLSDRFGMHKTVAIALAVSAAGGIARAFCGSYVPLLIMSLLLGFTATFCNANITKMAMLWFPAKQVGTVVGIITAAAAVGLAVAQGVMGFLFDDFYTAFLWGGILMAVLLVVWTIFARDKVVPDRSEVPEEEKSEGGTKTVLKNKGLWLAGFSGACYNGFNVIIGSLLITALVVTWGVTDTTAGIMASLFTIGAAIGAIVLPTLLVRIRKAKVFCILMPIVSALLVFLAWNIDVDVVRLVLFPIAGFIFGGIYPLCLSYPSILPGIDDKNSGTAGGLVTSIALVGGIVVPSFIVTPIAGTNYVLMMQITVVVGMLGAIGFSFLPSVYAGDSEEEAAEA